MTTFDVMDRPATEVTPVTRSWRHRLVRTTDDRIISGLAGGLGLRLGIPSVYVRAAFVVLAFAGGAGILVYAAGWLLYPDDATVPLPQAPRAGRQQRLGLAIGFFGLILGLRAVGLWFGGAVVWPVALVSFGIAAVWDRGRYDYRSALTQIAGVESDAPRSRTRVIVGGLLMFGGAIVLLNALDAFQGLGTAALAVGLTAIGFLLVFGPWVWRLADDLGRERRERIRSEERSEMAAHLHDSVLQTLALIQRSDDARRMVTLARAQERELRDWLYATGEEGSANLSGAMTTAAARVEHVHDVPVDVVTVGERSMDERLNALVGAASEAMTNAAKHSGADKVSVYVEASEQRVDAWISDQGSGFDQDAVAAERHGIAESIRGRMSRHRGAATITSTAEGTEVHLSLEGP